MHSPNSKYPRATWFTKARHPSAAEPADSTAPAEELAQSHIARIIAVTRDLSAAERSHLIALANDDARQEIAANRARRRRTLKFAAAAAAAAVLATLATALYISHHFTTSAGGAHTATYSTAIGETHTYTLEDGTVAHLNARTELTWTQGKNSRELSLVDGEVLLDVAHNAAKPFSVKLENSEIRVTGTRFNVYRSSGGKVTVTVVEGTVKVSGWGTDRPQHQPTWTRTLHADEQISYTRTGLAQDKRRADTATALSWQQGRYAFDNEPLSVVLEELGRYSPKPVLVADPAINDIRVAGALGVRDVVTSLSNMAKSLELRVTEEPDRIVISHAEKNPGEKRAAE